MGEKVDALRRSPILQALYLGGKAPPCLKASDSNHDGRNDASDAVFLITELYSASSGTGLSSPGPFTCGFEEPEVPIRCDDFAPCR